MRRNHNTWWTVATFDQFMYHGRKHGWQPLDCGLTNICSSYCICYTKSRAYKLANQLKTTGAETTIYQVTFKHGKRSNRYYAMI
jgi:hypothetical protein